MRRVWYNNPSAHKTIQFIRTRCYVRNAVASPGSCCCLPQVVASAFALADRLFKPFDLEKTNAIQPVTVTSSIICLKAHFLLVTNLNPEDSANFER
jgi:hypothetical protein